MNTNYWNVFSVLIVLFFSSSVFGQVFWTESFGEGCNQGTLIDGFTTSNGEWEVESTGTNGADANIWYVSATSSFTGEGNCDDGCLNNANLTEMSLHVGKANEDNGAVYANSGDVETSLRAESPTIDCSNYCAIELSFDFLEIGSVDDKATLWFFNGTEWIVLADFNKSVPCLTGAEWQSFSINLPETSHFNSDVKIAFEWSNGTNGDGEEVSFAVDNIVLASSEVLEIAEIITPNSSLCDTTSIVLEAVEVSSGLGEWKVVSGTGTFNNQYASTTGVNNLSLGENIIIWEIDSPQCNDLSRVDSVTIVVYQLPFPASNQDIQYNCGEQEYVLSANTPNVGQGLWYAVGSTPTFSDTTVPNAVVSDLNIGWNELVWQISNGSCPISRDTLSLFYKPNATIFNVDTTICVTENELFLVGNEVADPMTNVWAFVRGNGVFENQTATETMVTNLAGGLNEIILSQNHPFCGVSRDTITVLVELCEEYNPRIPTLFTPNNDGKNDLFIIENLTVLYPTCEVQIVNRWGNIVYESEGYNEPWDGTLRNEGEPVPLGTYFYRIDLNDGSRDIITGSISVVR